MVPIIINLIWLALSLAPLGLFGVLLVIDRKRKQVNASQIAAQIDIIDFAAEEKLPLIDDDGFMYYPDIVTRQVTREPNRKRQASERAGRVLGQGVPRLTIEESIRVGNPDWSEEKIKEALSRRNKK